MLSGFLVVATAIAVTYSALRALIFFMHDPREPTVVTGYIPYVSPVLSMLFGGEKFYLRLRDQTHLDIYTLNLPGLHVYVVNSLYLLQRIDRQITTLPFAPVKARMCRSAVSVSEIGMERIYGKDRFSEDSYLRRFSRDSAKGASPGPGLDNLARIATKVFAAAFEKLESQGRTTIDLYSWVDRLAFDATTSALYGPKNPFLSVQNREAWLTYESKLPFMFAGIFPKILVYRALKAREVLVSAFARYLREGSHREGSLFVQLGQDINDSFNLSLEDRARIEVGQVAASNFNTGLGAYWGILQVLTDPVILKDCTTEVLRLVETDEDNSTKTIDLARLRTECPVLLSTWREVMRLHGTSVSFRVVHEDTVLDNKYLLKKGGLLLMPTYIFHTDEELWGPTARIFNHTRFLKASDNSDMPKTPAAAFRGYGGGHILCPGRHLADTETLALMALVLLRVDVVPVGGKWPEILKDRIPARGFPLPKTRLKVDFIPKDVGKWHVEFSSSKAGGLDSKM